MVVSCGIFTVGTCEAGWSTDFLQAIAPKNVQRRIRDPDVRFSFMGIRDQVKNTYKILGKHCISKGFSVFFTKKNA
jgi:hypothetical protein